MRSIYLDHAATSPVRQEVLQAMLPYFAGTIGNASSLHTAGQKAKRALEEARRTVATVLKADDSEVYFTSGGTESNNLAIKGVAYAGRQRGRHLITTSIEHHSVLHAFRALEQEGLRVTYLPVDRHGLVDLDALRSSLREDTLLVSVMLANNEVGTLEPLAEIAAMAHERGVLVHTDAVQAVGKIALDVRALGVDLLSLTAHKFYGPKGSGALYVRKGVTLVPLIHGGHQERSLRPGTENIAGIVGLASAMRLAVAELSVQSERVGRLRDRLEAGIRQRIPRAEFNGHHAPRVPSISNISFAGVDGESLLLALDTMGIAISTGSACTAGSTDPSHVLSAMGVPPASARAAVRFSLGHDNSDEEIDFVIQALATAVERLRDLAPAWSGAIVAHQAVVGG